MKFTKILVPALFGALMVAGCSKNCDKNAAQGNGSDRLTLESYEYDEVARLTEEFTIAEDNFPGRDLVSFTGYGVLPVASADNASLKELRDSLIRLGAVKFDAEGKASAVLGDDVKAATVADTVSPAGQRVSRLSISYANPRVIVWRGYSYAYIFGAAHGGSTLTYVNYDVADGKILSLPMLLNAGYEQKVIDLLREALKGRDDVFSEVEKIPDTWGITDSGIEFVWQEYEIGPYSSGQIKATLYTWQLQEENLLSDLGKKLLYFSPDIP